MDIADWRDKIDALDRLLVDLLNRRAKCVLELAKIKKAKGYPVDCSKREMSILNRVQELNKGPLKDEAVKRVFERILNESRELEKEGIKSRGGDKERG